MQPAPAPYLAGKASISGAKVDVLSRKAGTAGQASSGTLWICLRSVLTRVAPAAVVLFANTQLAFADSLGGAGSWPNMPPFQRGTGNYLSWFKIVLCWLVFLAWVRTSDMLNQDIQRVRQNYVLWNSVLFFPFVVAFLLVWMIPLFGLGFFLLLLAYIGPMAAYVYVRNSKLPAEQRILTPDHLRHWYAGLMKSRLGVKVDPEKKSAKKEGPPVNFTPQGAKTDRENTANLLLSKQSPGWPVARELVADMFDQRADAAMLDYQQTGVAVRYQIDGVWHNSEPRDRETGDPMLAVFKTIAALNANQRQAKQEGAFAIEFKGQKRNCKIVSQGVQTGERVVIQMIDTTDRMWTYDDLGMRGKIAEQLKEQLEKPKGFVVFSALPAGGLSTTLDTAARSLDRFMRDVVAVEDQKHREHDIQNVQLTTFDSAAGETALSVLPKLVRTYPNVIVMRDLADGPTVEFLCDQVEEERLVISGIRAKESAEALLRVLMLKAPAAKFAAAATAVVHQRLIRKLCEKCKEAYAPPPETLKQLGIPAGKVQAFYRPPQPQPDQPPPPPCEECLGVGYLGRTAIFELLVVDDGVRASLVNSPKLETVRAAARKAGMRTLQEEGIVAVVKGITSLAELMRVLKT